MFELEIGGGKLGECHLTEHVLIASKNIQPYMGTKYFGKVNFNVSMLQCTITLHCNIVCIWRIFSSMIQHFNV